MTKVLNFFGGPGVGKSTTATGVFHELKKRDIPCEYVSEYAKSVVWDEATSLLQNQIYVFAKQLRWQFRLINKVDYIITDSPILLSSIYYRHYQDGHCLKFFSEEHTDLTVQLMEKTFMEFDNVNFVLHRTKKYQPTGRLQTEEEAREIDCYVIDKLDQLKLSYHLLDYERAVTDVISFVEHGRVVPRLPEVWTGIYDQFKVFDYNNNKEE